MPRKKKEYLQLKINIQDEHPPVWRRVVVPQAFRLDQLHAVIQIVFGWENYHLHQFWTTKDPDALYVPETDPDLDVDQRLTSRTKIFKLLNAGDMIYEYDFGDSWEHRIHLEKILTASDLQGEQAPFCLTGRGADKQEDSHYEEDNDAAPFNKAAVNEQLLTDFPTETSMPQEYSAGGLDALVGSGEETARKIQNEPDLLDALLAGKTVVRDGDNAPVVHDLSSILGNQFSALDNEVDQLTGDDKHAAFRTASHLISELEDGEFTTDQQRHIAQRIIDDQLLLFHIDVSADQTVYNRMAVGALTAVLIAIDTAYPMLPPEQLSRLFDQAEHWASQEKNDSMLYGTSSAMGAALVLLQSAIRNPAYTKDRAKSLFDVVLQMVTNLDEPFMSEEPDRIAQLFVDLLQLRKATGTVVAAGIRHITQVLDQARLNDHDKTLLPFVQIKAWQHVLTILHVLLGEMKGTKTVWNVVDHELKEQWQDVHFFE
ncbi:IS1096 element passenger TnpR family protein [Schleiferilactobacillus shenzhenensis]|uniref:IS1096 element passenger TnpR family protein n=1 Tax=Schleiferilactobacillus shenzhenensis TaxID=1231337 RepID=UPI0018CB604A|nr:DUF2785 domain-containing protein [Schleiferilactobacillus shenzhenensis]